MVAILGGVSGSIISELWTTILTKAEKVREHLWEDSYMETWVLITIFLIFFSFNHHCPRWHRGVCVFFLWCLLWSPFHHVLCLFSIYIVWLWVTYLRKSLNILVRVENNFVSQEGNATKICENCLALWKQRFRLLLRNLRLWLVLYRKTKVGDIIQKSGKFAERVHFLLLFSCK